MENGPLLVAIRVRNRLSPNRGRLPAISQNFRKIAGNPSFSENDPFWWKIANKNRPNCGTKQARGRRAKMIPKMGEFLVVRRVRNRVAPNSGRLSAILQNFREIMGNPSVSGNGPFR